MHAEWLASLAC